MITVDYYVPTVEHPANAEDYNPQVYETGTPKAPGWLTPEEFAAAFPPPVPEPPSLEEARAAALEALRLRKWQAKDAGITVNGVAIDTDDRGQATISGAVLNCLRDPDFAVQWKTAALNPDGTAVWVTLGQTEINALADALTAYTEACFAVEKAKQAEIAALTSAEAIQGWLAESLDAGWPAKA
jgi:hypothetical protein